MLNKIPAILSPELMKTLMEMGHGDEITFGDANFPVMAHANRVVRADGLLIPDLLKAVMEFLPLDHYNDWQYALCDTVGDDPTPSVWSQYDSIIKAVDPDAVVKYVERFDFYDLARRSHTTVLTGETALYGNIVLRKGVVVI